MKEVITMLRNYYVVTGITEKFFTREEAVEAAKNLVRHGGWTTVKTMRPSEYWGGKDTVVDTVYIDK
jgi:hypothetical protein